MKTYQPHDTREMKVIGTGTHPTRGTYTHFQCPTCKQVALYPQGTVRKATCYGAYVRTQPAQS